MHRLPLPSWSFLFLLVTFLLVADYVFQSSTSSGYSLRHMHQNPNNKAKSNNKFLTNSDVYCIALCEYVPTCKQDGEIVVHPDEDCVITRFFFVFTAASIPANSTRVSLF
jgi:hypothetical protein